MNRNWADAERDRDVCARAEQKLSRCRERGVCACWTETEQTRRERERGVCACWTETEQMQRERCVRVLNRNWADAERDVCARAEQKLSRRGEREREVCARAEQKLSRCRERCVCACWTETEQMQRERCVRVLGKQDLAVGSTGDSLRLNKVRAVRYDDIFRNMKIKQQTYMHAPSLCLWEKRAFSFLPSLNDYINTLICVRISVFASILINTAI